MSRSERDRFREVEDIFDAAVEQAPGAGRDAVVGERCGGDESLRTEITRLLAHHEHIRTSLPPPAQHLPRFGAWQAVKILGRGGMGTVYLAERADGAFQMSAAVKVVSLALVSRDIEERFLRERQFLASLDHPKIARLIDGGVTESGLPYLVMEFVSGLTIDGFCEVHQLDIRARIVLMRQVLDALSYVHGRLVIHRDVKPSNILVGHSGSVKLLDFGTARLVDATAETALTKTGIFAFTPDYASPEQVRGEPAGVTSDLYSAGVLLYRLLTGRLPYRISDTSPAGVAKTIARRQPDPSRLEAPLNDILTKALRKDASGRYQSAAAMDADLARYLDGQRVRARRAPRKAWAAAAAVLAAVGGGAVGLRWFGTFRSGPAFVPFETGVPNAMQPALSDDGKWLAMAASPREGSGRARTDIWLKRLPHGEPRRVTGGEASNDEPALSPDGRWLAFHSTRAPAGIYLQPAAGGAARLLVEGGRVPRFSPDGQWIAYLNTTGIAGDTEAFNASTLYGVPAVGGRAMPLARNVSSVQGFAWSAGGHSLLFLSLDESGVLRLWMTQPDGGPATMIPDFAEPLHLNAHACAATEGRLLYAVSGVPPLLVEFLLGPARHGSRSIVVTLPPQLGISDCAAAAHGPILADETDDRSGAWVLPVDADSGAVRGPLAPLTKLEPGSHLAQFAPDGASLLTIGPDGGFFQDYPSGTRRPFPSARVLSSDGAFVLRQAIAPAPAMPAILDVVSPRSGESWGRMQTNGVPWDLSAGGRWMLAASTAVHRVVVAWDTRTSEHQAIYAHPSANLYLANFSSDGRWVLMTSEERDGPPHLWAAPFRDLQNVPMTDWVDLGEGDFPRWSPDGGRIYFTEAHEGSVCIFTRALDPATKRPTGAIAVVQHFHGRLTPTGVRPGTFRLSVARDKLSFSLGERIHQLWQLR